MQYESTTVSLLTYPTKKITGQTATLAADGECFTLTATDSPFGGKHQKKDTKSVKLLFMTGRVVVTTTSHSFVISCSTKDSRLVTILLVTALLISSGSVFWMNSLWWLPFVFATLFALKTAYMCQKRYLILGLLK